MKKFLKERWVIPVATLVLTLSIGSAAFAATGSSSTDTSTVDTSTAVTSAAAASTDTAAAGTDTMAAAATESTAADKSVSNGETALTGDILAQVKAAALAAAGTGSTPQSATDETDNSDATIKYEAFVTKSDGTSVKMYLDASFKVVSTETGKDGRGGHGGKGGHAGETALTGTTLEQVKAVAVAKLGSGATIDRVETDAEASETGHGPYEVHATLADGTNVVVYVDSSFNYVSTETMTATGHDKDSTSDSAATSGSTSTSTSSN